MRGGSVIAACQTISAHHQDIPRLGDLHKKSLNLVKLLKLFKKASILQVKPDGNDASLEHCCRFTLPATILIEGQNMKGAKMQTWAAILRKVYQTLMWHTKNQQAKDPVPPAQTLLLEGIDLCDRMMLDAVIGIRY